MSPAAIDVRGLVKSYGERAVLQDLSFAVGRGELVGLIGPNGAGKSTLLRTLIGLVRRDSGSVSVLGLDPDRDALAIRAGTCYLPGETSVYQQMTGQQFLDFALGFYQHRQQHLLAELIGGFALPLQQLVRSYSAGMKQKLAILATLGPDVDVYLLDEPDRALDASVRFFLRDVLRRCHQAGKTIVLSSHHLSEVETLADRIDFLVASRIVPDREVAEARARLRRQLRLRLLPDTPLPPGAHVLRADPDGTLVLSIDGEPLHYLGQLPPQRVLAAEVGAVRLEELYQLLTGPVAAAAEVPR